MTAENIPGTVQQLEEPPKDSTLRWLWRFGLVRSTIAWTFTAVTLLQSAIAQLPDPSDKQWDLLQLIIAFYFVAATAQGVASQTAAAITAASKGTEERKDGAAG